MKTIYFSTFAALFGTSIFCIYNYDTTSLMLSNLCLALSVISWLLTIYFLRAFVSYEERVEEVIFIKNWTLFMAGAITAFIGFIAIICVINFFMKDISTLSIIFSLGFPSVISFFICTLTSMPTDFEGEVPDEKGNF